jgi:hypothetical protein
MLLIDLEIRAARRQDLYAFVLVRDQLLAIQENSAKEKEVSTHEEK